MKYNSKSNSNVKGFTLVEMIGVLAVIAILTAMLIPKVFETINSSRISSASSAVNTIKTSVASHYSKHGAFADSTGTVLTPDTIVASTDAANFDTTVLLPDGMLEKRFSVKIGDQKETNLVRVRLIEAAEDSGALTPISPSYDMDGVAGDVDTNDGALVCECVITGVSAADARGIKQEIDGSDITALSNLPAVGGAATKGRVKYEAIAAGATGTVLVYVAHR
ncbi:MAG: prepilin-type N-terminal cleavage/methylation domain-containing protein [Pseudoalteromonas tetraodonis]|jgi:prepilin-type N-terminal cleavage/methylation domain-containing protein